MCSFFALIHVGQLLFVFVVNAAIVLLMVKKSRISRINRINKKNKNDDKNRVCFGSVQRTTMVPSLP